MKKTPETLAQALRCTAQQGGEHDCQKCKWSLVEYLDEHPDIRVPSDDKIHGRPVWISCDCDRIALEAADELERLGNG